MQSTWQNTALLILRLVVGAIFLLAGYAKIPLWSAGPEIMPAAMILLMKVLTIVEPLGALAVIFGLATRWSAGVLGVIMIGAILVMQFMMQTGFATTTGAGWNFPLMILAGCLVLMAFGAGAWSLDAKKKK